VERRSVLKAGLAVMTGLRFGGRPTAQPPDPRQSRPQENDRFVFASGARAGDIITPSDVPKGGPPVLAYPIDPQTTVVRDGSRLNQIVFIHLDPQELVEATPARSANGIVAYSAVCTHTGCDVTEWRGGHLLCPCHDSEFDPRDGARVRVGPAPRRLAALPLKLVDGGLVAAGGFLGRLGPME
jgi:Rieske Fe-S protein